MTGLMERLDDIPQARLDRPGGRELHRVLAGWPRSSHLPEMEWTHVLLKSRPLRPLVHRLDGRAARREAREEWRAWKRRSAGAAAQRQRRLRRVSRGDAAQARRGAARVPRLPRPAARRQGPRRVRPVHERAAQSAARHRTAGSNSLRLKTAGSPPLPSHSDGRGFHVNDRASWAVSARPSARRDRAARHRHSARSARAVHCRPARRGPRRRRSRHPPSRSRH